MRNICMTIVLSALCGSAGDLTGDSIAVRALLDFSGQDSVGVWQVAETLGTRIYKLSLHGGMTSVGPQIGRLDGLKYLFLESNVLTTLPQELAACTSIVRMYLSYNQFDTIPACVLALPNLFDLRISSNKLTRLPTGFENMHSLDTLFCDYNLLDSIPASLCRAHRLKGLNFRFNRLTHVSDSIGALDSLAVLTLCCNQLANVPDAIASLPRLRLFDCGGNRICSPDTMVASWLDVHAGNWRTTQICDSGAVIQPIMIAKGSGSMMQMFEIKGHTAQIKMAVSGYARIEFSTLGGRVLLSRMLFFTAGNSTIFTIPPAPSSTVSVCRILVDERELFSGIISLP
jgi:hypothetical protein